MAKKRRIEKGAGYVTDKLLKQFSKIKDQRNGSQVDKRRKINRLLGSR